MPRMYFTVPPCRFCQLDSGNEGSHTDDCSQLYVHACATFRRVAEAFCEGVRGTQYAKWDLQVSVRVGAGKYWCLLVPDARLQYFQGISMRDSDAQVLILTWSGLSWVKYKQRTDPKHISVAVMRGLVCQVLEGMERSQDNALAVRWPMSVPDGHLSPYHQCPATSQTVSVLAQQVLAWLLRWDQRLQYNSAGPVHVLLPLHRRYHGPLVYQVTVCTKFRCHC